jgi:hypothetical protein
MRHIPVIFCNLSTAKQGPSQRTQVTESPCYRKCLTGAQYCITFKEARSMRRLIKQIVIDSQRYALQERVHYINLTLKSLGSCPRYSYVLTHISTCILSKFGPKFLPLNGAYTLDVLQSLMTVYEYMVCSTITFITPLTPGLSPSAQRCLARFFYWGFCFLNRAFR